MISCKLATLEDLDNIQVLYQYCSERQKEFVPTNRTREYYKDLLSDKNSVKHVAIACQGSEIFLLQEFVLRRHMLSWHLNFLFIRPSLSYFNCRTNGLSDLYDFCFSYAESKGYYYYDWSQRVGKLYENRFERMKSQIPILQRYDHYDIGYIPANTLPTREYYAAMIAFEPRPYDTLVRSGVLKNQYRKNLNLSE